MVVGAVPIPAIVTQRSIPSFLSAKMELTATLRSSGVDSTVSTTSLMKTVAGVVAVRRRRNFIAIMSLVSSPRKGSFGPNVHSYFFDIPMLKVQLSLLE